ncbi:hypothetical protein L1987_14070 [Smallanthus sonchifolius]|uniref:Uncharacterized protein n=1 Tax=Smallanthus sonchifolius TaxID=185202 RepID=A0ACB9J4C3_9ASTR|nr:hypothetical protein L1987_14070 [Smallanthus sonchifolius]
MFLRTPALALPNGDLDLDVYGSRCGYLITRNPEVKLEIHVWEGFQASTLHPRLLLNRFRCCMRETVREKAGDPFVLSSSSRLRVSCVCAHQEL